MANRRRPIIGEYARALPNGLIDPFNGGKSGGKDPRRFVSGNIAGQQWDIAQQSVDRQELNFTPPPHIADTTRRGYGAPSAPVRTVPTRVNMVPWSVTTTGPYTPTLLIPRNPERVCWQIVCNDVAPIVFSYGAPQISPLSTTPAGQILEPGVYGPQFGFAVPINDIYVWSSGLGQILILGYEGLEAPEANQ